MHFSGVGVSRRQLAAVAGEGDQPYQSRVVRGVTGVAHAQCP